MKFVGLQSSIRSNRLKSVYLILAFPAVLAAVTLLVFTFMMFQNSQSWQLAWQDALVASSDIFIILGPIMILRGVISFFFHRQMIFAFAGAKPVTRTQEPKIYNIVENLCISRGLPTPNIGIMEDHSMNAFAVGRNPKKSRIVFSRGILEKLEKHEIEAVAAHELTHIINKDGLLMIIAVVFIGVVTILGQILIRIGLRGSGDSKKGQVGLALGLAGIVFIIVGYIFFPFIQLALSRKREFLADAGSVELTKDKEAMISALQKIAGDPTIEEIKQKSLAAMCIASPAAPERKRKSSGSDFFSTHPSIERRIAALRSY